MNDAAIEKRERTTPQPQRVEQAAYFTPLVDVAESNDEFLFQVDLPGVKPGDVDVSYESGTLTIEGRVSHRQAGRNYLWQEYGVGHFYRQFSLAAPINADGIKAQLKNGVLELHVPKAESAKPRRIEIQTA